MYNVNGFLKRIYHLNNNEFKYVTESGTKSETKSETKFKNESEVKLNLMLNSKLKHLK